MTADHVARLDRMTCEKRAEATVTHNDFHCAEMGKDAAALTAAKEWRSALLFIVSMIDGCPPVDRARTMKICSQHAHEALSGDTSPAPSERVEKLEAAARAAVAMVASSSTGGSVDPGKYTVTVTGEDWRNFRNALAAIQPEGGE